MQYLVRRRDGDGEKNFQRIAHFHPSSSDHRPDARFCLEYDDAGLYVTFTVSDRYVLCRGTQHQSMVCRDSCVEAFVQPRPDKGYFNFETNCGGAMLLYYVSDATRVPGVGLKSFKIVPAELLDRVRIEHSMPTLIAEEIDAPVQWWVWYFVPNDLFEHYVGPLGPPAQRHWRGNFYKCADESSHPHWASWRALGPELNFHSPELFAEIRFEA